MSFRARRPRCAAVLARYGFGCVALSAACARPHSSRAGEATELAAALDALDRKVCLTMGARTNGPQDRCEPQPDRATYLQPLREVFLAAPPIFRAYLCSMDRIYFDYHSAWNANFFIVPDSATSTEYRSIGVRRGVLENRIAYSDWATAWTQHWWTGGPHDHPSADPGLPRVEVESTLGPVSTTLYQLIAHEAAHALAWDYRATIRREPFDRPFEPGEFGYISWVSPYSADTNGVVHPAIARETALEAVRTIDFDGDVKARLTMMHSADSAGRRFDPGTLAIEHWRPASRDGIHTFLERLDQSSFTTVFSTWRPEDDWTESFAMVMLMSVARRYDIVTSDGVRARVLAKVADERSRFAPKRQYMERVIDRALTDFRARQSASPTACLAAALAQR